MIEYPHQEWRLLTTPPSRGAWNMALDEAILEAVEQKAVPPTLRLYSWDPPCLSIGYAQLTSDIDFNRLSSLGWDWVRRPTGGRAILHTDELTYSVVSPLTDPRVAGGVLESYQRLSVALLKALHLLGIPARSQPDPVQDPHEQNEAVCFEVPSNYEIIVHSKKIIGSAQARRRKMLLQHGTLPLNGDLTRITQVLVYPDEGSRADAARRLLSHATTVETILGNQISLSQAGEAFISAFQTELNLILIPSGVTEDELNRAGQLVQTKYTYPSWLERL